MSKLKIDGKTIGKIVEKNRIFPFSTEIGDIEDDNGNNYQLYTAMHGFPIVHSKRTGKKFIINWEQLTELAIAAGIDEEGE